VPYRMLRGRLKKTNCTARSITFRSCGRLPALVTQLNLRHIRALLAELSTSYRIASGRIGALGHLYQVRKRVEHGGCEDAKVVEQHGAAHAEVKSIQELLRPLADELSAMMKEENVVFPYLAQMEAALREGRPVPPAMFGSVDHDPAGALTARIRSLSGGFAPPTGNWLEFRKRSSAKLNANRDTRAAVLEAARHGDVEGKEGRSGLVHRI
jgi:hypothetical protein